MIGSKFLPWCRNTCKRFGGFREKKAAFLDSTPFKCYNAFRRVRMEQFVLVKDHTVKPLCGCLFGQTAENDKYVLKWFYDEDYAADRDAGRLRLGGIVCELTPKHDGLFEVLYTPEAGDPVIKISVNGTIPVTCVEKFQQALETAKMAAELAVEFMRTYITT